MPTTRTDLYADLQRVKATSIIQDCIRMDEGGWVFTNYDVPTYGGMTFLVFKDWHQRFYGARIRTQTIHELIADDPKALQRMVIQCYRDEFYEKIGCDLVSAFLRPPLFSAAVNLGPRRAVKLLQRCMNRRIFADEFRLVEDGIFGRKTHATFDEFRTMYKQPDLRHMFCAEWQRFYIKIVQSNPEKMQFLLGWFNRAEKYRK